ncbi:MAG: hypothetical protein E4H27_02010 [Anaerolineales bacterium]|nr:MAG: hypothetical protein E4H27_02010 [Anaerolineales bacterium]
MQTKTGILNADYKVAGGKLLRVIVSLGAEDEHRIIRSISINGDFFMHPEEAIEALEQALTGVVFQEYDVEQAVDRFFAGDVEVIGAGPLDIVHVIMHAGETPNKS